MKDKMKKVGKAVLSGVNSFGTWYVFEGGWWKVLVVEFAISMAINQRDANSEISKLKSAVKELQGGETK